MNISLKKIENEVQALIFFGLGAFLALSLASYTPTDPSFNSIGNGWKTANYCGLVGSFTADLLFQVFGLMSWVITATFFHAGWTSLHGAKFTFKDLRHVVAMIIVFCLAALAAIYWPQTKLYSNQIYPGGLVGLVISTLLMKALNSIGAQVFLWTLFSVFAVLFFEIRPSTVLKPLSAFLNALENWWAEIDFKKLKQSLLNLAMRTNPSAWGKDKKSQDSSKQDSTKKEILVVQPKSSSVGAGAGSTAASSGSTAAGQMAFAEDEKPKVNAEPEEMKIVDIPTLQSKSVTQGNETDSDEAVKSDVVLGNYETPTRKKVVMPVKAPRRVENWSMPKLSLLEDPPPTRIKIDEKEIRKKAEITLDT